jgi:hypothetical protein
VVSSFFLVVLVSAVQDSRQQGIRGEVKGEEDQVHWRAREEGADAADRGHHALRTAHASSGIYNCCACPVFGATTSTMIV